VCGIDIVMPRPCLVVAVVSRFASVRVAMLARPALIDPS